MYSVHIPTLIFTMHTCTHFVLFTQCPWWAIRGRRIPWHCWDAYRSWYWSGIHWSGWEWNWTATTGYKVRRNVDITCLHEGVGCGCMHRYIVHDRVQSEYCDAITPSWFVYSEMYDSFDPFSVCLYLKKPTTRKYDIQCELYRTLVTGDQKYDLNTFTKPSYSTLIFQGSGHCPSCNYCSVKQATFQWQQFSGVPTSCPTAGYTDVHWLLCSHEPTR